MAPSSTSTFCTPFGTKQPAIARIESGEANVTLRTVRALAEALNATARVEMAAVESLKHGAALRRKVDPRRVAKK